MYLSILYLSLYQSHLLPITLYRTLSTHPLSIYTLPTDPPFTHSQVYKQTVEAAVLEFIPLTVSTILLQPSQKARLEPSFNKEVYVDFVAVQIKFLSFLAYIIRIFQDQVWLVGEREGWGKGQIEAMPS